MQCNEISCNFSLTSPRIPRGPIGPGAPTFPGAPIEPGGPILPSK